MAIVRPFTTGQFQQQAGQEEQGSKGFNYAHFILPAIAFTSYLYLQKSDTALAAPTSKEEDKKGGKENKIRFFGTPGEIYKNFATMKDEDGCVTMNYQDFFRALTPYNYQKSRQEKNYFEVYKKQVDSVMQIADVDGDGSISFMEFFFFVLVSQTPSRLIRSDFNKAGGCMDVETLTQTLARHRKRTTFGQKLKLKTHHTEDFQEVSRAMCERIFNGKDHLHFDDYMEFRNQLQEMLWHYEFHQFDCDSHEKIDSFDFAQSLFVYYIPFHKIPEYLEHLEQFRAQREQCCDVRQYGAFQYFLKQKTKIIQTVMADGQIDFAGLRKLTDDFEAESPYCKKHNVHISDGMLRAFLTAFDLDGNGVLDVEETVGIITNRKEMGSRNLRKQE